MLFSINHAGYGVPGGVEDLVDAGINQPEQTHGTGFQGSVKGITFKDRKLRVFGFKAVYDHHFRVQVASKIRAVHLIVACCDNFSP